MSKILLIARTGFSNQEANGITMKVLLSAWPPDEKAVFYCDVQSPDYTACSDCFRTTDMDMLKAFLGKGGGQAFSSRAEADAIPCQYDTTIPIQTYTTHRIPQYLKQRKYDFRLKWLREILWLISPWGHARLQKWISKVAPKAVVYMVGESIFLDKLVLKICKRRNIPLILYNCEAFRLIDVLQRKGLEREYYKCIKNLYKRLYRISCLVIYNSVMLKEGYEQAYSTVVPSIVAYNSADIACADYIAKENPIITYFGNLGVGRVESLVQMARTLSEIDSSLHIDLYGKLEPKDEEEIRKQGNLVYHGFISAEKLQVVIENSDILLHTESFLPNIALKLKYAFSTKIAQCLRAGRCLLSYVPKESASAQYLLSENCSVVATNESELRDAWKELLFDTQRRTAYAKAAELVGTKNHNPSITSRYVKTCINKAISKTNI